MNNSKRSKVAEAQALIAEALKVLTPVATEEQAAWDKLPEGLKHSDTALNLDDAACELHNACEALKATNESLQEIIQ